MTVDGSSQAKGRGILGTLASGAGCLLLVLATVLLGFSCSPANTADAPALLSAGLRVLALGGALLAAGYALRVHARRQCDEFRS